MKVTLNIEKRYAYGIMGLLILVVGLVAINAYGTSSPSVFGHSGNEVDVNYNGGTTTVNAALADLLSRVGASQKQISIYRNNAVPHYGIITFPNYPDGTAPKYSECVISVNANSEVIFDDYIDTSGGIWNKWLHLYASTIDLPADSNKARIHCDFSWQDDDDRNTILNSPNSKCQVHAICVR